MGWSLMSVASIISTSGSAESGSSEESDADNKDQLNNTLVSPAAATVVEGFVGAIGGRGIHPAQTLLHDRYDAACSALSPNNWAITPPPAALLGVPLC